MGFDISAAAPGWVRNLLTPAAGEARVIHSGPDAVYLQVDRDVIAVLSRQAVGVPCGLTTTLATIADLSPDHRPPAPGTRVAIGQERLHLAGTEIRVVRTTSHASPVIDTADAEQMALRLSRALDGTLGPAHSELPHKGLHALAAADPQAVDALLGLGSGLTPLGDDVLSGWLAALAAASHLCSAPVADRAIALADERTTSLSATLLRRATHAEVIPEFAQLVHVLANRPEAAGRATHDLTRIGHTSGLGLALGLTLALDHLGSRSTCP